MLVNGHHPQPTVQCRCCDCDPMRGPVPRDAASLPRPPRPGARRAILHVLVRLDRVVDELGQPLAGRPQQVPADPLAAQTGPRRALGRSDVGDHELAEPGRHGVRPAILEQLAAYADAPAADWFFVGRGWACWSKRAMGCAVAEKSLLTLVTPVTPNVVTAPPLIESSAHHPRQPTPGPTLPASDHARERAKVRESRLR